MGINPSPSDPMPPLPNVKQEEPPMGGGMAMRGQRGGGIPSYARGNYGGYNYTPHEYGYTGGYGHQRPSGPHSAVPPPNSLVRL